MFPIFGAFMLFSFCLVSGCAGLIPSEFREKIQWDVGWQNLQQNSIDRKGQLVLLGGEILDVKIGVGGDTVEVLQRPLNSSSRPNLTAESQGRFVILLTKDITLGKDYREGQPLTVVGEVTGEAESRTGKDIPLPVLLARYLHLWTPADYASRSPSPYYYSDPFLHRRLLLRPRR